MAIDYYPRTGQYRPSSRIQINTDALTGNATESDKPLMLVGAANGGQPGTVYRVKSYEQAKQIFRGGELLDAIEVAWNASPSGYSAGDIYALRAQDATQASLTDGQLTITSNLYAKEANQIQVSLQEDNVTQTKKLSVVFPAEGVNKTYTNLGSIFSLTYKGKQQYASYEVTTDLQAAGTEGKPIGEAKVGVDNVVGYDTPENMNANGTIGTGLATHLILRAGADADSAAVIMDYPLGPGAYSQTYALINDINNLPDFEAHIYPIGNKNVETRFYDKADKTKLDTEDTWVKALGGDIIHEVAYDATITVTFDPSEKPIEDLPAQNLVGGSTGMPPVSWADLFDTLADEPGYYLVPLTDSETVHAEALAFVNERSESGFPMRTIVGAGLNESKEALLHRAASLKDGRTYLVGSSGAKRMNDGTVKDLPGYQMAALIGGIASGLDIGASITFKILSITSLDTIYNSADLDQLDQGGVIMVEYIRNRSETNFRVADDVSTYNDSVDPVKSEMGVGEDSDFLVADLKEYLDTTFIGAKASNVSASVIKAEIIGFMEQQTRAEVIASYDAASIQVTIVGSVVNISGVVTPTRNIKHINFQLTYANLELTA